MASEMYHLITKQVKQPDEFANSFNLQGGALSEVRCILIDMFWADEVEIERNCSS